MHRKFLHRNLHLLLIVHTDLKRVYIPWANLSVCMFRVKSSMTLVSYVHDYSLPACLPNVPGRTCCHFHVVSMHRMYAERGLSQKRTPLLLVLLLEKS